MTRPSDHPGKHARVRPHRWGMRIATSILAIPLLASPHPSRAAEGEDLRRLESEAEALIERLKGELDAVRAERRKLEAERKELQAERERARRKEQEREQAAREAAEPAETEVAAEPGDAEETKRRVNILAREFEKLKENLTLPEDKAYKSFYGLGPAASKVYQVNRGLSLGGYGEANLGVPTTGRNDTDATADFLRFVLYTGYKFSDRILMNAEIEFEHATTEATVTSSGGSVSLEFGYLDFLAREYLNFRTGLVLIPLGFINEIHEPVFFYGNNRPLTDRNIIPTTWRELGAGVFGSIGEELHYRGYATTSLNAEGFSSSGIRGGRQKGSEALAEDIAGSMRLDYTPHRVPGLLVGASAFLGGTGQDQEFAGDRVGGFLSLWDVHGQYQYKGLWLRSVAAFGNLGNAANISLARDQTIASKFQGYYAEIAYDLMPYIFPRFERQTFAPFFRFEHVNPQQDVPSGFERDRTKIFNVYQAGFNYKPHPQVVLKLDWRGFDAWKGEIPNDINFGFGFIF